MTAPSMDARPAQPPNTMKVRNATQSPRLAGVFQSPDGPPFSLPGSRPDDIESLAFESQVDDRFFIPAKRRAIRRTPSALPPFRERLPRRTNSFCRAVSIFRSTPSFIIASPREWAAQNSEDAHGAGHRHGDAPPPRPSPRQASAPQCPQGAWEAVRHVCQRDRRGPHA